MGFLIGTRVSALTVTQLSANIGLSQGPGLARTHTTPTTEREKKDIDKNIDNDQTRLTTPRPANR